MTEKINSDILDNFQRLSSYDIRSFLQEYVNFIDVDYADINNFYIGSSPVVPKSSFTKLAWLIKEQKKIIDVFTLNAPSFDEYQYWALLEYVEDIGHALATADNASKWLRSSITKIGYRQEVRSEVIASQGEGLEAIERDRLRSPNFQDTWVNTALQNELREEDYTLDGGYLVKAVFKNGAALFLNGVVDNIDTPEKTYGRDIDRNIVWQDSDISVLSYDDTLIQCVEILSSLKKGDDPAFIERGINSGIAVGSNIAAISYPIIFRDMAACFATDDSFKSFEISSVRREQDALFVDFRVRTKTEDFLNKTLQIV